MVAKMSRFFDISKLEDVICAWAVDASNKVKVMLISAL
jgi:hypothetical protein